MRKWNPDLIIRMGTNGMSGHPLHHMPNYCFDDVMGITGIYENMIELQSLITSKNYLMYSSEFDTVIKRKLINNTSIKGKFSFTKKGNKTCLILL